MMPSAVIDACCLIDLLATGHAEDILRAANFDWYLPTAVEGEVLHIRAYDPTKPGQYLKVDVDLSPLKGPGLLQVCAPADQTELDQFVYYASVFRSDGEAMCLAIAEQRGWVLATDDRKAIRVARQAGLTVISCPALVKNWADTTKPNPATLQKALMDIQLLAQFKPNSAMPEYPWWVEEVANIVP